MLPACDLFAAGDYQFEEAMLRITSCQVHTFDCTYSGKSVDKNRRHHYHEWCIGIGGDKYRSWDNITRTLAHDQVDLLKMDIGMSPSSESVLVLTVCDGH